MGAKSLVCIEEHSKERVVSFDVDCCEPEGQAWNALRAWATKNLKDYKTRRYIGCAPKGHHPDGQQHQPNEASIRHEYKAQMFVFSDEGNDETFMGAEVYDAPKGLFLVGDVSLNQYNDNGSVDIGSSMMVSFETLSKALNEMGGYVFAMDERPYYEEHIFDEEWFSGKGDLAGFKLWLPIRKI